MKKVDKLGKCDAANVAILLIDFWLFIQPRSTDKNYMLDDFLRMDSDELITS